MATTSAAPRINGFTRQGSRFQTTVDMASTASTNGGVSWAVLAAYNVEWIDIEITVATKDVTVAVTQDYAGGTIVLPTQSYALTAGATVYHCLAVVPGTIPGNAVTKGTHVVTVTLTSTLADNHGTCTGKIHLYGHKLI